MIRVGVLGASGRMGQALLRELKTHKICHLSIAGTRNNTGQVFEQSDVITDFTTPQALPLHVDLSLQHKKPLVVGTTGLQPAHHHLLSNAAATLPLLVSPNMSIGITVLASLAKQAASLLDDSYDIEISELHHRYKKDAPSGTALMLAQTAAQGRNREFTNLYKGDIFPQGKRERGSIHFAVQRGGTVTGDHAIRFIGDEEMVELSHRGFSSALYARGALHAASWIVSQKPGLYSMYDVLGL